MKKTLIKNFVALSLLLHKILRAEYRGVTNFVNDTAQDEMDEYDDLVISDYLSYLSKFDVSNSIKNKMILEIGTGKSLGVAMRLAAKGNTVVTLDRFPNLNNSIGQIERFAKIRNIECQELEQNNFKVGHGYVRIVVSPLELLNSEWIQKFDLILSRATLEHVTDAEKCVMNLDKYQKSDGYQLHEIDHRDHGIFSHFKMCSNMAFHTISKETWSAVIERFPGVPNKVSSAEYHELFSKSSNTKVLKINKFDLSDEVSIICVKKTLTP